MPVIITLRYREKAVLEWSWVLLNMQHLPNKSYNLLLLCQMHGHTYFSCYRSAAKYLNYLCPQNCLKIRILPPYFLPAPQNSMTCPFSLCWVCTIIDKEIPNIRYEIDVSDQLKRWGRYYRCNTKTAVLMLSLESIIK